LSVDDIILVKVLKFIFTIEKEEVTNYSTDTSIIETVLKVK
jgi:hypothetical protein